MKLTSPDAIIEENRAARYELAERLATTSTRAATFPVTVEPRCTVRTMRERAGEARLRASSSRNPAADVENLLCRYWRLAGGGTLKALRMKLSRRPVEPEVGKRPLPSLLSEGETYVGT